MRTRRTRQTLWNSVGLLLFIVMVFPVYWMVSTAFKPDDQVNSFTPTWLSLRPTIRHFSDAIHPPFFWNDLVNTVIIVSVTGVIAMTLAFLASAAVAKYRFTGGKFFILLLISIQTIPPAGLPFPCSVVLARR